MPKKQATPKQFFTAAAIALVLGLVYTLVLFNVVLGPGMLVLGAVFLGVGVVRQRRAQDA